MSATAGRSVFSRYAVAFSYLAAFIVAEFVYALLPGHDQAAAVSWASTSVHNLEHDPAGCLAASAFITTGSLLAWPFLIAMAMFGANKLLGNWRLAVTCAAAHIIGTLVSEGIMAARVDQGSLPVTGNYLTDVGPSYIVVAAIAVGLLHGRRIIRALAAIDFVLLVFVGHIFAGLTQLQVSAVGHLTALFTGAAISTVLMVRKRGKVADAKRNALPAWYTSPEDQLLNWAR
jgi:hypothetical protein